MKTEYNSQAFTPEDVEKGLHLKFLTMLLELNAQMKDNYNDIHIYTDGYCTVIDWYCRSYDEMGDGKFEFVDGDQYIMTEYRFPDNHTELCADEEDFQERLKNWLEENPGWVKTPYGTWTNEIENQRFREEIERQMRETSDLTGHD